MNSNVNFAARAVTIFVAVLVAALVVNYVGSLLLYDELRMALDADALIALIAAIISYFRALQAHIAQLEQRIDALERKAANR